MTWTCSTWWLLFVLLLGLLVAPAARGADPLRYDVTHYGAIPNDGKNDTKAIMLAINAANTAGGGTVYFPGGTYQVSDLPLGTPRLTQPLRQVTLLGDGAEGPERTVLKRIRGQGIDAVRVATMRGAQDVVIHHMAFDANGIQRYGGFVFYGCTRVTIRQTRFFDSAPAPYSPTYDRYAYVFGFSRTPHEDVIIADNRIEDLQLEVDNAKRVQIAGNTLLRSDFTGAIGSYALHSGHAFEDVQIVGNTIIDAARQALAINLDFRAPNVVNNFRFRNIAIRDNVFIYTPQIRQAPRLVLRIGAGNTALATTGNTFENIQIAGNRVYVDPGTPPFASPLIFGPTSKVAGFKFVNMTVRDNTFYYDGTRKVIDIRRRPGDRVEIAGNQRLPSQAPPP